MHLAEGGWISHDTSMFLVTESDAAAIRAAYEQSGELAAAVELGVGSARLSAF
jgi:hypothetical protein